jgi:transcriptional regulator with XRE-family HTH domain
MDDLGAFLRSRRARLTPEHVGLASYGPRRVPGLRREELAQLAGVSATYYTRLERGQSTNASESVIEALARALELDDDERAHLHRLARPGPPPPRPRRRRETVQPATVRLVEAMGVPAVVLGRRTDVLAWNARAHRLLAGHIAPDARPNLTRLLFLDAHTRELYARWDEEAARAVAMLRILAGRFPDDPELAELVGELSMKSPEFAALWAKHPVANCVSGVKHLRHPELGALVLEFQALNLPDDGGQRILTYTGPGLELLRAP